MQRGCDRNSNSGHWTSALMKRSHHLSAALLGTLVISIPAAIADHQKYGLTTGHDLLVACQPLLTPGSSAEAPAVSRCRDYLSGFYRAVVHLRDNDCVSDVQELSWRTEVECLRNVPEQLTFDQLLQLVSEYGQAHPESLDGPPADLVKAALSAAFP